MLRFIAVSSTVIGFLIFSVGLLWKQNKIGKTDQNWMEQESIATVRNVFRFILKIAGITVTVKGLENIPKDRSVLYVGNHRSYFDILVGYTTVPGLVGFVAKKEMEHCPLLSDWMANVNCLFLDRKNLKEGLKTILQGIENIKRGVSVWIFPEGTRNRNKDLLELLPFKEGSLKIAEKSGCPVVPVAITGTAETFEEHFPKIRPSHVTIEFGTPFIVKELQPEEKKFSGAYTRKIIIEMLWREQHGLTGDQKTSGQD
ncbi:MAG: 1-acylglycerol-3-phosphate O-acyltransferase [Clostridium sp.]